MDSEETRLREEVAGQLSKLLIAANKCIAAATARATAAESALAEARGALRRIADLWECPVYSAGALRMACDIARAALARAGEQETRAAKPIRWGRHELTQVYHRWLPAPVGIRGTVCGAEGEGMFPGDPPIGAKICNDCLANELAAKAATTPPPGEQGKGGGGGPDMVRVLAETVIRAWATAGDECESLMSVAASLAEEILAPAQPAEHPASGGEEKP